MHKYSTHQCRCWAILILPQNYEFSSQFFTCGIVIIRLKIFGEFFVVLDFCLRICLADIKEKAQLNLLSSFGYLSTVECVQLSFFLKKKEVALHIHHLKSGYSCNIRKWPYPEPFPRIIRVWRKKQYISYSSFSFKKMYVCGTQKRDRINQLVVYSLFDKTSQRFLPDSWINTHFLLSLPFLFRASYSPVLSAAPWFWPIILVLYAASRLEVAFSLPHVPGWTFVVAKMCYFRRMKQRDQMQFHYYSPGRFHLSQMGNGREIYLENGWYVFQGFYFFCKKKRYRIHLVLREGPSKVTKMICVLDF